MEILKDFGGTFLFLSKLGIILFLLIYIVFAVVVRRQVKIMTGTLEVGFETTIKTMALIHLVLAFIVLILSLFIL